jgi:hypothetical protein
LILSRGTDTDFLSEETLKERHKSTSVKYVASGNSEDNMMFGFISMSLLGWRGRDS